MAEPKEPLTERELEVVRLLATGVGNKEIAAQLHVSPNTVRVHLRNIFIKLEAQSRTEVTMIAVRNGWVAAGTDGAGIADQGTVASNASIAEPERIQLEAQLPIPQSPAPAQPVSQPVPVAPNPQPLPALPMWQRIALIVGLLMALGLMLIALQRAPADTSATASEALLPDGVSGPAIDALPAADTRWYPRSSVRTARARSATVAVQDKVYVIGGEVDRTPSAEVLIYDPKSDQWRDGGRKPTPVMNAGAVAINDVIYVPGGTTPSNLATDRFEALDVISGEWRVLPSLPRPLAGHAVAALGDRLYVVGGRSPAGISGETFVFDTATQRWSSLAPLSIPRSQLAAAALNNRIYAVGGFDGKREYTTCEYLQVSEGRWHECAPMTIPRGSLGVAQVGSALYAIGGGLTGYIGFNERYDPASDKWVPFEMPAPRLGDWRNMGVASLPTRFYAVGGATRGVPLSDNFVYEVLNNRTFLPAFQAGEDK